MLFGKAPDRLTQELFDTMLIFHAEHGGGNNSTFSTRCVSSSGANTYMALCAGIGSLSGHLHGGANEAVVKMISDIKRKVRDWESDEEITSYLEMILDKKAGIRQERFMGWAMLSIHCQTREQCFSKRERNNWRKWLEEKKSFCYTRKLQR